MDIGFECEFLENHFLENFSLKTLLTAFLTSSQPRFSFFPRCTILTACVAICSNFSVSIASRISMASLVNLTVGSIPFAIYSIAKLPEEEFVVFFVAFLAGAVFLVLVDDFLAGVTFLVIFLVGDVFFAGCFLGETFLATFLVVVAVIFFAIFSLRFKIYFFNYCSEEILFKI